jgi:hypothetical protein
VSPKEGEPNAGRKEDEGTDEEDEPGCYDFGKLFRHVFLHTMKTQDLAAMTQV